MNRFSNRVRSFSIALVCSMFALNSNAQQGRLPTPEELQTKATLQNLYMSSPGAAKPNHLLITGPEQDCDNAIPVCQQTYSQPNSYTGHGTLQEVNGTCLMIQESNSVWYVFTVQNSGTFTFLLNTANDYDFALYDITSIGCAGVPSATPVRCNYSATYGSTGLTLPTQAGNLSYSASQGPTMPGINVTAGQTFVLIIDNFSNNSNGYTLTFGGSAQIYDVTPPSVTTYSLPCSANSININFSEPVTCASIASNGSDFTITGPGPVSVPVTSAVGNLCSTGASNTNYATVGINNAGLTSGIYTVTINNGTDGNTILDKCGNAMAVQSFTFQYLSPVTVAATSTLVCSGGSSTLTASVPGNSSGVVYSWSPVSSSSNTVVVNPTTNNTYVVTATFGGCSYSASIPITVSQTPLVSVNPSSASLCSGTTNIVASATIGGAPCTNCNYSWTGTTTQTDNAVPSSTITGAGAGSYSVSVTSPIGCPGNTAVSNISILSPAATPACNIIYVSPAGGGNGVTPSTPTDIQTALTMAACNSVVIKMQIGDYPISNPLNMGGYVTIEGGYNVGFTLKTSAKATAGGFPAQGTRIIRTTTNVEGTAAAPRLTAINVSPAAGYFRLQDLRIDMPDNAAGTSISNYGIYLGNGCHDYNITRCYVYSGNAGTGATGAAGAPGAPGAAGSGAPNGGTGTGSPKGTSGAGGKGGGTTGGNGGTAVSYVSGAAIVGSVGTAPGSPRDGGGGASGGTGVYNASASAPGAAGGNGANGGSGSGSGAGQAGGAGLANSSSGCGFSASTGGANGLNGATGANGATVGTTGVGSDASGYWLPGNGGTGSDGFGGAGGGGGGGGGAGINPSGNTSSCSPSYGTSAGGAGGGGGGQGGAGGIGGGGGGATYGIFVFNNGANGYVVDCQIVNGLAGTGGAGGAGGTGGTGGAGGTSASNASYGGCGNACNASANVGNGGKGGNGGNGGTGAAGGAGGAGIANQVKLVGGSALVTNSSLNMLAQPVITVDNKACTNVNIDHNTAAASPSWTTFGPGAAPASGSGSPATTVYSTLGRKTIVMNANNYTDFNNIIVNPPSTGSIVASAAVICPGTANFASTAIGTAGLLYSWSVSPATATVASASSGSTTITFDNTGTTPITYTITLNLNSNCCGALLPVTTTITVNPIPASPTASATPACVGGVTTFSATAPTGVTYNWYNAPSAGTLLATGSSYSISPVSSSYTVYVSSTNSGGCTSTLTPVVVSPTVVPAPTVVPGSACDIGQVQVGANPVAGVTTYNWYSDPSGTTLVQSSNSLNYSQYIGTAGGSYTVYVQSVIPGCTPSALAAVSGSVSANPITASPSFVPDDTVCVNSSFTISITPGGGTGAYTYSWTPVTSTSNTIVDTVGASTSYNVYVTSGGCTKQFLFPIIVAPYPKDTIVPPANLTCSNPTITLDGSNSDSGSNYSYSWTTTGGNILTSITANTVSVNAGGTYSLSITDLTTGCTAIQSVTVTSNNTPPTASITPVTTTLSCTTPTMSLDGSGSTSGPDITYSWVAVSGNIASGSTSSVATTSTSGTYVIVVTNTLTGCSAKDTVTVTGNSTPPNITVTNTVIACGSSSTSIVANSTTPNVTFSWTGPNAGSILSNGNTNNPTVADTGSYTVLVTDAVNGCTATAVASVSQSTISAAFTANPTSGISPLDVTFTNQSTGALGYTWVFGDGNANSSATNPNHTYTGSSNTTYTVELIATAGPCADTAYATIFVEAGLTLEIPNVFTPNGDNVNDVFTITSTGVKEITLEIFNRWGQVLYSFTGPKAGWDGRESHGGKAPDGTYFFFVKAKGFDDKVIEKNGTVNLYR